MRYKIQSLQNYIHGNVNADMFPVALWNILLFPRLRKVVSQQARDDKPMLFNVGPPSST